MHNPPLLSIIIPTLNEEEFIGNLIRFIKKQVQSDKIEILVCDGGSKDDTCKLVQAEQVTLLISNIGRRSVQMNYAASHAKAALLYFLHADAIPPSDFIQLILRFHETNNCLYCFPFRFNSDRHILRLNEYVTHTTGIWTGGGDQSLLIQKSIFQSLGGFNSELLIMEDYDLIKRARKNGYKLKLADRALRVSDRKYRSRSWLRVQATHLVVFFAWHLGANQHTLVWLYRKGIH